MDDPGHLCVLGPQAILARQAQPEAESIARPGIAVHAAGKRGGAPGLCQVARQGLGNAGRQNGRCRKPQGLPQGIDVGLVPGLDQPVTVTGGRQLQQGGRDPMGSGDQQLDREPGPRQPIQELELVVVPAVPGAAINQVPQKSRDEVLRRLEAHHLSRTAMGHGAHSTTGQQTPPATSDIRFDMPCRSTHSSRCRLRMR